MCASVGGNSFDPLPPSALHVPFLLPFRFRLWTSLLPPPSLLHLLLSLLPSAAFDRLLRPPCDNTSAPLPVKRRHRRTRTDGTIQTALRRAKSPPRYFDCGPPFAEAKGGAHEDLRRRIKRRGENGVCATEEFIYRYLAFNKKRFFSLTSETAACCRQRCRGHRRR